MNTPDSIRPADVAKLRFERDGYVCPVSALSPLETRHYRDLYLGFYEKHHLWIVHGSNANVSDVPRIGFAIRYVSTRVKQDGVARPFAMLVRGHDEYGNFRLTERPSSNDGFAVEGRHAEFIERVQVALAKSQPGTA